MLGNIMACLPMATLVVLGSLSLIKVYRRKKRYNILLRALANVEPQPRCTLIGRVTGLNFIVVSKYVSVVHIAELNWDITIGDPIARSSNFHHEYDGWVEPESYVRNIFDCNKCKNRLRCLVQKDSEVTFEGDRSELTSSKAISDSSLTRPFSSRFTFEQANALADGFYEIQYGERQKLSL